MTQHSTPCSKLSDHYDTILREYNNYTQEWITWPQYDLHTGGWSVIPLWLWPEPEPHDNLKYFPETARLVEEYFPHHRAVGFSRLAPHTRIHPHVGDTQPVLRYHLGIDCPQGDCALVVEDGIYHWSNGHSFVFDDHKLHAAYNNTNYDRVILIIDFEHK